MNKSMDVRWKQRFQNFDRAFELLRSALSNKALSECSDLEQEGIVQRFEFSFELAWKTMKDYLEDSGIVLTQITPRNVIKEAFRAGVIPDGQVWIDMMLHRNLLSHTYDFSRFKTVLEAVVDRYIHVLEQLHSWFAGRLSEDD
jgi:nucleotidyltransferase substrate binding protein (TIGR01987 family)